MPFGAGIAGWILGLLILFGLAWPLTSPDTVSNAVMWAIRYWWAAFAFGLAALVGTAVVRKIPLLKPLLAYVLPAGVMALLVLVCTLIYPHFGFREDLLSFVPVAAVFYIVSWLWITFRKESGEGILRAVTPPLFGGILILAWVAIPVFSSNGFIYRNAFTLEVLDVEFPEQSLVAKCVLEIRKPGDYDFKAPPLYFSEMFFPESLEQEGAAAGSVVWGDAGKPGPDATGRYPLEIRWKNLPGIELLTAREMIDDVMHVILEAHVPGGGNEIIYALTGQGKPTAEE